MYHRFDVFSSLYMVMKLRDLNLPGTDTVRPGLNGRNCRALSSYIPSLP